MYQALHPIFVRVRVQRSRNNCARKGEGAWERGYYRAESFVVRSDSLVIGQAELLCACSRTGSEGGTRVQHGLLGACSRTGSEEGTRALGRT